MKNKLVLLFPLILVLGGVFFYFHSQNAKDTWICKNGQWVKVGNPSFPKPSYPCQEGEEAKEVVLANPTSQNCLDKGGKLKILKETAGELGICQFEDGSECEEWQLYQGLCQKGQYKNADTTHPYSGVIKKVNEGYLFKSDLGVEYNLLLEEEAKADLKERLLTEASSNQRVTILAAETPPKSKILILKGFQEK